MPQHSHIHTSPIVDFIVLLLNYINSMTSYQMPDSCTDVCIVHNAGLWCTK